MTDYSDPLDQLIADPVAFARQAAAPLVNERVGQLAHQVGQLHTQLNQERVQRLLDDDPQLGSSWRKLDVDPGFLAWLNQVDMLANERRLDMLHRAYRAGDADRVKFFFKSYRVEQIPPSQRTAERLPYERDRPTASITERDLQPRRLWRRETIARFFEDVRRGRYADREIEKLRIEREIITAARENRIIDPPEQFHK